MQETVELRICMGSACHQRGVNKVLPILERMIAEQGIEGQVALKGAFCLGPCIDGIVIQLGGRQFLRIKPDNIETRFTEEMLPEIRRELDGL